MDWEQTEENGLWRNNRKWTVCSNINPKPIAQIKKIVIRKRSRISLKTFISDKH